MPSATRIALIALVLLVAIGGAFSLSSSNQAQQPDADKAVEENYSLGECTENGVSLVVDFGSASELDPIVRCAQDFEGSGWEIFQAVGLNVRGTVQYPIGFVCQIEGEPQAEDCLDTPSYSDGSWGYYILKSESGWQVSGIGSASRQPKCGEAEGWRFLGAGESPGENMPSVVPKILSCSD